MELGQLFQPSFRFISPPSSDIEVRATSGVSVMLSLSRRDGLREGSETGALPLGAQKHSAMTHTRPSATTFQSPKSTQCSPPEGVFVLIQTEDPDPSRIYLVRKSSQYLGGVAGNDGRTSTSRGVHHSSSPRDAENQGDAWSAILLQTRFIRRALDVPIVQRRQVRSQHRCIDKVQVPICSAERWS